MEMPKPTAAHRKLECFVGSWSGEERLFPSPWDPKGGNAVGRVVNRLALDGFVVVQDYEQERGGAVTFRGHGVFRWDSGDQCYVLHWFDSMGMPPNEFRGQFDAEVLTLYSKSAQGDSRAVFDFGEPGKYLFRLEVSRDRNHWVTFTEGRYTRAN
jgi:hypothetical protein